MSASLRNGRVQSLMVLLRLSGSSGALISNCSMYDSRWPPLKPYKTAMQSHVSSIVHACVHQIFIWFCCALFYCYMIYSWWFVWCFTHILQGLCSLSGQTSYRKISWSLEAERLGVIMLVSLWNLKISRSALLSGCLSNFRWLENSKPESSRDLT